MSREKEGFRDMMERLNERFPEKELLSIADVSRFLGVSRDTARKYVKLNAARKIAKTDLARQICV